MEPMGKFGLPTASTAPLNGIASTPKALSCAAGVTCFAVTALGKRQEDGVYTAQCGGRFPDFVDLVPADYVGDRFRLSQSFPSTPPTTGVEPWLKHDFKKPQGASSYLQSVLDYVAEGMAEVDWRAERNTKRSWYHVPWMTAGAHPREFLRGMTEERPVRGPELGLKRGVTIQNWAVGFYNAIGGYTIGQVWAAEAPNLSKAQFPIGTVVAKILFSDVVADDFSDGVDLLAGAPAVDVNLKVRGKIEKKIQRMRLMQIDVAVRDQRTGTTGWVFGTFAYDKDANETDPWRRMKPVGLMWGNDPQLKEGAKPIETIVDAQAPVYARNHLGMGGRMNGPVDNPVSSCLSCHSTAQYPNRSPMSWDSARLGNTCDTYSERMQWFRNLKPSEAFGEIESTTCTLMAGTSGSSQTGGTSLDYSLQLAVGVLTYNDGKYINPCTEQIATIAEGKFPATVTDRTETFAPLPTKATVPKNRYPIER